MASLAVVVSACINPNAGKLHNMCGTMNSCDSGLRATMTADDMCLCEIPCRSQEDCPNGLMCRRKPANDAPPQWTTDSLANVCVEPPPR